MSADAERARARAALVAARARVTARRRLARNLAGDPVARRELEESWAPLWRAEPWEVEDDADLW